MKTLLLLLFIGVTGIGFGQNIEEIIKEKTALIELEADSLTVLRDSLETKIKELEEKKQNELAAKETELDLINIKKSQNILASSLISQSETQNKFNELLKIENIMDTLLTAGAKVVLEYKHVYLQSGKSKYYKNFEVRTNANNAKVELRQKKYKDDLEYIKTTGRDYFLGWDGTKWYYLFKSDRENSNKLFYFPPREKGHKLQAYGTPYPWMYERACINYTKDNFKRFESFVGWGDLSDSLGLIRKYLGLSLMVKETFNNQHFIDLSTINKSEKDICKLLGVENINSFPLYTLETVEAVNSVAFTDQQGNEWLHRNLPWCSYVGFNKKGGVSLSEVKQNELIVVGWDDPKLYQASGLEIIVEFIHGDVPAYQSELNMSNVEKVIVTSPHDGHKFHANHKNVLGTIKKSKLNQLSTEYGLSYYPKSFNDSIASLIYPKLVKYTKFEKDKKEIDSIVVDTKLQLGEITALVEKGEKEIHRLKSNYREQITPLENKVLKCNFVIDSKDERIANVTIEEDRRLEAVTEGDKYKKEKNYKMAISKYKMALNIRQSDDINDKLENANKLYAPILAKEQAKEQAERQARQAEEAAARAAIIENSQTTAANLVKAFCLYDCIITKAWINNDYRYKNCYSVFVSGNFQNGFGAYRNVTYEVSMVNGTPCGDPVETNNITRPSHMSDNDLWQSMLKLGYMFCRCD